jgi:hypothetical protein
MILDLVFGTKESRCKVRRPGKVILIDICVMTDNDIKIVFFSLFLRVVE